jgi:hypothetical protein
MNQSCVGWRGPSSSYGAMIATCEGADAIKEVAMQFVQFSRRLWDFRRNSVRKNNG